MHVPRPSTARPALVTAVATAVATACAGCTATPDAADLVTGAVAHGPVISESDAAAAMFGYVDAVNDALRTGETDRLAAMTGPSCPCGQLVGLIEARSAAGSELVGASFDAGQVSVLARRGRQAQVSAHVWVSPYTVRNADGTVVERRPAEDYVATYTLRMVDEGVWSVVDVRAGR
jgi:hypothetical protein